MQQISYLCDTNLCETRCLNVDSISRIKLADLYFVISYVNQSCNWFYNLYSLCCVLLSSASYTLFGFVVDFSGNCTGLVHLEGLVHDS